MKRPRIYLDTSVISHLDAPDVPEKEADTQRLWEDIKAGKYEVVISDLTLVEMRNCPEPKHSLMREAITQITSVHVERNNESQRLSDLYVEIGGLPPKSRDDATHIAMATINSCDIVLSWNFRHIVNLRAMTAVEAVNIKEGYKPIRILSPAMILEERE
jgi:predicted nucleic acid-binding protein